MSGGSWMFIRGLVSVNFCLVFMVRGVICNFVWGWGVLIEICV